MEWHRDTIRLTDDRDRLDMDHVCRSVQSSYWAEGRPREIIEESFRNSLCFGLFDGDRQIGFTRIVTDRVIFSWFCDVWVDPEYRGQGLGQWMLRCVMEHPDVALTRMVLITKDAQSFYEKLGFERRELLVRPAQRPYR
jgi:ribosomal protein S18 acetylase RimI-like enzyme